MKSYPLLEKAPADHKSKAFLTFLKENNKIVKETDYWLVIENCKYHTEDRPWYTAFVKDTNRGIGGTYIAELELLFPDFNIWLKTKKIGRSIGFIFT